MRGRSGHATDQARQARRQPSSTTDATPTDLLRLGQSGRRSGAGAAQHPQLRPAAVDRNAEGSVPPAELPAGQRQLISADPDFADAYRMVNSAGIFRTSKDTQSLALGTFQTNIVPEGYRLVDPAAPGALLTQSISEPAVPDQ